MSARRWFLAAEIESDGLSMDQVRELLFNWTRYLSATERIGFVKGRARLVEIKWANQTAKQK